jgi:hypothetical protein
MRRLALVHGTSGPRNGALIAGGNVASVSVDLPEYKKCLEGIPFGKRVHTAVYVCREEGTRLGEHLDPLLAQHGLNENLNQRWGNRGG